MHVESLIVAVVMSLGNIGAIIYIGKMYVNKVDGHSIEIAKHDSLMAKMIETLDVNSRAVKILFEKNDVLAVDISDLSKDFSELKGEHNVLKNNHHQITGGNF